jgi:AP-3 complex subunit beta
MDSAHLPSLIPIVSDLLKDPSPLSIGATAIAFSIICPTRLDLLHPHYRRLCRMLLDMDVWGQVNMMELLSRYARAMLPKPNVKADLDAQGSIAGDDVDPDLGLLLTCTKPMLLSRNPAVSLAPVFCLV